MTVTIFVSSPVARAATFCDRAHALLGRLGALVATVDDVQAGAHLGAAMDHLDSLDLWRTDAQEAAWAALGALNRAELSPCFLACPQASQTLAGVIDDADRLALDISTAARLSV